MRRLLARAATALHSPGLNRLLAKPPPGASSDTARRAPDDREHTDFPEHWLPDKASAYRAPRRASRYAVRLVCWAEPATAFKVVLPYITDDLIPRWLERWDGLAWMRAHWDATDQRIVVETLWEEDQPRLTDSAAEIFALYLDRDLAQAIDEYVETGGTAIIDVYVPGEEQAL
jgi:hypothetical protein